MYLDLYRFGHSTQFCVTVFFVILVLQLYLWGLLHVLYQYKSVNQWEHVGKVH